MTKEIYKFMERGIMFIKHVSKSTVYMFVYQHLKVFKVIAKNI